jgi:hypothetical protein
MQLAKASPLQQEYCERAHESSQHLQARAQLHDRSSQHLQARAQSHDQRSAASPTASTQLQSCTASEHTPAQLPSLSLHTQRKSAGAGHPAGVSWTACRWWHPVFTMQLCTRAEAHQSLPVQELGRVPVISATGAHFRPCRRGDFPEPRREHRLLAGEPQNAAGRRGRTTPHHLCRRAAHL